MSKIKWPMLGYFAILVVALFVYLYAAQLVQCASVGVVIRRNNVDLGRVTAGKQIRHRFELWNISFQPIEIAAVSPQCSCSVVSVRPRRIRPFLHSDIVLKVDTTTRHYGHTQRAVGVTLRDGYTLTPLTINYISVKPKTEARR